MVGGQLGLFLDLSLGCLQRVGVFIFDTTRDWRVFASVIMSDIVSDDQLVAEQDERGWGRAPVLLRSYCSVAILRT